MGAAIIHTDTGRSRGPYLAVCWHTDITATCSRDTTTIYLPPSLLHASFPSRNPSPVPLLLLPSLQTPTTTCVPVRKRATRAGRGLQCAPTWMTVKQGEHARDPATRNEGNLRRRAPVTRHQTDHKTTPRTHQPRGTRCRFGPRRRRINRQRTRGRLDASSRSPGGASPAGLLALNRAPPPPLALPALDRAPPPGLPGSGRP